jgi:antitoxin ParD1/3/4
MSRNTSITLGRHFERFIATQVKQGRYGTVSEVVRAGLRVLEERESKLEALRAAVDEGDSSGFVENYSVEAVLDDVRRKKR